MKLIVKNLSNKNPTKDISLDDKINKLKISTSKKRRIVNISKNLVFGEKNIPIIAGPNGVESKKLMVAVAKQLTKLNIKILRGHAYNLTFHKSSKYKETQSKEWIYWMN